MIQTVFMSRANVGTLIEIHTIIFGTPPTRDDLISYSYIISEANKQQ